jgi:hypothetical protein
VGDVERAVHSESGWEEKLLASKYKESTEGCGGGGTDWLTNTSLKITGRPRDGAGAPVEEC